MRQDKGGVKKTNLFELFATITLDDSGYKRGLDEAANHTSKFGESLKNGLATAAKVGTAAITAAATGVAALTKASVQNYAEYEQLVGGAQLMFGDAYDFIADKAKNAYSTVQMSQNEYLQQVNGFATGLKTALGGNEQAAAELADRIINAEADIVAATGNTAENVQNAFNGIMKSNYTMLDNLQLGITPTKEGFQEVIDKVNEWNAANGNATNYMIDNLADAQNALVDYIEMQGLAGYAANEASQTISGSLASAKAAWSNLVTGVADDNANFEQLINNFVKSASVAINNIIPRVEIALTGVLKLVDKLVPVIVNKIPTIITKNLPTLTKSATKIIEALVNGIRDNQNELAESGMLIIKTLIDSAVDLFPDLVVLARDLIVALGKGLAEYVPQLIPHIEYVLETVVDFLTNKESLQSLIDSAETILMSLADGLIKFAPKLIDGVTKVIVNLAEMLTEPELLTNIITAAIDLIVALGVGLINAIPKLIESIPVIIDNVVKAITGEETINSIISAGETLCESLKNAFLSTDWLQVGKDIVNSLWAGAEELWGNFMAWVNGEETAGTANKSESKLKYGAPRTPYTIESYDFETSNVGLSNGRSGRRGNTTINYSVVNNIQGNLDDAAQQKNDMINVNRLAALS